MITLAVITGVSPDAWERAGARGVATAFAVLEEIHKPGTSTQDKPGRDGKQYSG